MGSDGIPERPRQDNDGCGQEKSRSPGSPPSDDARQGRKPARANAVEGAAPGKRTDDENLSFEQIIAGLQGIVGQLEQGDAPLEEALATYEQGVRLSRLGAKRLDEAERRIEMLMSDNEDGVQTRPLEKEPDAR